MKPGLKSHDFVPNFANTDLSYADLEGAALDGVKAKFANLSNANLSTSSLVGADLRGANLDGANLFGATLDHADLELISLKGANLTSADLDGTVNVTQEVLNEAFGDARTRLPKALTRPAHWPDETLSEVEAIASWQQWRKALEQ